MSDMQGEAPILASETKAEGRKKPGPPRRRRQIIPTWLVGLLFLASGLAVAGAFYIDVVRLGPTHKGLVIRAGKLVSVYEPGQVAHKIPLLERIVELDISPRPLPAARLLARSADGRSVRVEIVLVYRYVDAAKVWDQWKADDFAARGGLVKELTTIIAEQINATASSDLLEAPGQAAWLEKLKQGLTARWTGYGIEITELRVVEFRVRGPSR